MKKKRSIFAAKILLCGKQIEILYDTYIFFKYNARTDAVNKKFIGTCEICMNAAEKFYSRMIIFHEDGSRSSDFEFIL